MPRFFDTCAGSIEGLYLPPIAWKVLQREKIRTLAQLVGIADKLERVDGIEPRMAEVIRESLARVAPTAEQSACGWPPDPWCA